MELYLYVHTMVVSIARVAICYMRFGGPAMQIGLRILVAEPLPELCKSHENCYLFELHDSGTSWVAESSMKAIAAALYAIDLCRITSVALLVRHSTTTKISDVLQKKMAFRV